MLTEYLNNCNKHQTFLSTISTAAHYPIIILFVSLLESYKYLEYEEYFILSISTPLNPQEKQEYLVYS